MHLTIKGVTMKLNGWTWLIAGLIVSLVSGYVYLFIPKNGSPNVAMALFFFVGIIFIVVGLLKVFFTHKEDEMIMNAVKAPERKIIATPIVENRQNRIEQQISQLAAKQTPIQAQTNNINKTNHTNSLYNKYQYTGPVHQTHAPHAEHPATSQTHPMHQTPHHLQNTEHSLRCKSCNNINAAHANYCHQCGHRLR